MAKRKTYLSEDMRHKVAREYRAAKRSQRTAVAAQYNVSRGAVQTWVRKGYGTGARSQPAGRKVPAVVPTPCNVCLLLRVVQAGVKTGAVTRDEAARLLVGLVGDAP